MSAQVRAAYPLAVICDVLAVPRSSVYAREAREARGLVGDEEPQVRAHIERIAGAWPTYG